MTSPKMVRVILFTGKIDAMREFHGKVRPFEQLCLCDGKDPDGNPIQHSNR